MKNAAFEAAFAALFRDTLEPILEEHRAAVRADFRKALAEFATDATPESDGAFSTRNAAAYIGVSERTIHRMRSDGRLPAVRVGRQVRFRKADLDRYLAENLET